MSGHYWLWSCSSLFIFEISDLVGRDNWKPTMGSFEFDGENWWFSVVGKVNKAAKISVQDKYTEGYFKRYGVTLSVPPLACHKHGPHLSELETQESRIIPNYLQD